jgi:hypothetical protein
MRRYLPSRLYWESSGGRWCHRGPAVHLHQPRRLRALQPSRYHPRPWSPQAPRASLLSRRRQEQQAAHMGIHIFHHHLTKHLGEWREKPPPVSYLATSLGRASSVLRGRTRSASSPRPTSRPPEQLKATTSHPRQRHSQLRLKVLLLQDN